MPTNVDTVRAVFKTEWLGAGVVQSMIRQYGLAERAIKSAGTASTGTIGKSNAVYSQLMADKAKALAGAVREGNMSLKGASDHLGLYSKSLLGSAEAAGTATKAAGVLGTGLSGTVVALGAVAAAAGAAAIAFKTLYPAIEEGAKIAQLDQSFNYLNATMAETPNLLNDMREASNYTLSTMAAQEGIMTLVAGSSDEMTKKLADAAPRILEISKAANKLNPALGDTNFMFTSLAKGLKRAEPRLIDNLGLKLRVSDANRTLAAELGKSVAELTAEEKQLAILNETLRAGALLIEQVGGSAEGVQDPFLQLNAATTDFKTELKEALFYATNLGGVIEDIATGIRNVSDQRSFQTFIKQAIEAGNIGEREAIMEYGYETRADEEQIRKATELINENIAAKQKALEQDRMASQFYRQQHDPMWEPESRFPSGREFRDIDETWEKMQRKAVLDERAAEAEQAALDKSQAALDKNVSAAEKWAKGVNDASQKAIEAWEAYNASVGDLAEAHLEADEAASFFTTSVEAIGEGFTSIGGPTSEQAELIDKLQDKYDKAAGNLDDLRTGVSGFGMDEEKMSKAIEKATGEMAYYEAKIGEVDVAQREWRKTNQQAVWDWKKIDTAIYDAAKGADLGADDFLRLSLAIGKTDDASAEAALKSAALESQMGKLLAQVGKPGGLDPEDVRPELEKFAKWLENQDFTMFLTPEFDMDAAFWDMSMEERLRELRNREDDELDMNLAEPDISGDIWAKLFGEETMEPLSMEAWLETDPMTDQLVLWVSENGVVEIVANLVTGEGMESIMDPYSSDSRVGGRAGGGNAIGNVPILVGEQGPEIISPGSNSTVTPNSKLGDGVTFHTSINVEGSVGTEDLASVVEDTLLEALQQVGAI